MGSQATVGHYRRAPGSEQKAAGRAGVTAARAEDLLREYAAVAASRDERVLAALRAGVPKHRIHVLTGIARTTIDRIAGQDVTE